MERKYVISGSPHIHDGFTTRGAMWRVVFALMPAMLCAVFYFGLGAVIVLSVSVIGCVVTEYVITRFMLGRTPDIADGSAVLTGVLLAFNLPSNLPVWIVLIGAVVSIGIGKMSFGGLGCNIFNPAIVGRVFLLLSFPAQMTSWPLPLVNRLAYTDAVTGATILSRLKMGEISTEAVDLFNQAIGLVGGSLGEVSAIALLIGAVYLLGSRVITWHIPVSILGTAVLMSLLFGFNPWVELLSGGLILGAFFMATDYVTSPMTVRGKLFYGVCIGAIAMIIRHWGSYPEGVSFAILIMNGMTPLINRMMRPHRVGERRSR